MFWEPYYSGVGFSLFLQSVTRGPLRRIAFTFDKDLSTFISWNHLPGAFRHLKEEVIWKLKWKYYRWLKRNCVCGPSEIPLLWKVTFSCQCLRSVDGALDILTENPLAATSAEENQVLSRRDDPENRKTLQTSDESCRYFVQLCQILWSYKHWRLSKHKSAFRYYTIKQACWKLGTF